MGDTTSLFYWNDKIQKTQPRVFVIEYQITDAVTVSLIPLGAPVLTTFSALTQATIDNFLGTSSEFTAAQFDATAMGADAMGVIVNMGGQVESIVGMEARCYSAAGLTTLVSRASLPLGLTDSTLETAMGLGANGNMAVKIDWGNTPDFDALTAGKIRLELSYISK